MQNYLNNYPGAKLIKYKSDSTIDEYLKIRSKLKYAEEETIIIPVVFHVIYNRDIENISEEKIKLQIDVLNKDFNRLNDDTVNTPIYFLPVAGKMNIRFVLADKDINGNYFNGIIRKKTYVEEWSDINDDVKYSIRGGDDGWDKNKYMNVWVCNLKDGTAAYSTFPWFNGTVDGIVIDYRFVGTINGYYSRTLTHEVGHWLNLYHIWGDDESLFSTCIGSDYVDDTPNQSVPNYGCPAFPHSSCSNYSDMFMNYMDYTEDYCMNMFTKGQVNRMLAAIDLYRSNIKNSTAYTGINKDIITDNTSMSCYYDGSSIKIVFSKALYVSKVEVFSVLGRVMFVNEINDTDDDITVKIKGLNSGVYIVKIYNIGKIYNVKLIIP